MTIYRKLIPTLVVILLLITVFNINSVSSISNISEDEPNYDGYIIEFNDEPIVKFKNKLKETIKNIYSHFSEKASSFFLNQKVQDHEEKLESLHRSAKEEILEILGEDISPGKIFSGEFTTLFNGISIKNVPAELIKKIEDLPFVKKVFPNYRIVPKIDESVPLINATGVWNLKNITGDEITGEGITIAFLDSGVNYTHPHLADNYIADESYDFKNDDPDPMDIDGHGTHVTGIAVGRGNETYPQYVGVAPDAKFYSFKIIENDEGNFPDYEQAMITAMDLGVDIISLSFGTEGPGDPTDPFCQLADNAVDAGIVVVAAAGNSGTSGSNTISSPGCAQKVICVGSSFKNDKMAASSSRGPVEWDGNYMMKPDVVAPGVYINSCGLNGNYVTLSGTSMATPHVAGAAALLLQSNPDYTPEDVKYLLKASAIDIGYESNIQGDGRINVSRALTAEDIIYINAPDGINEKQEFTVTLTNRTGALVEAWIVFTSPMRLPKIKYGSSHTFKAPSIYRIIKKDLIGKIRVFESLTLLKYIRNDYYEKKNVAILDANFLITH
jgi:subtilisin family serine protease